MVMAFCAPFKCLQGKNKQSAGKSQEDARKKAFITSIRLKNPGGFYADDFDESCAWLTERGFRNARGEDTSVDARTDRSAMMISPSDLAFDL
jgi:hypothetical protein